jgi:superfamily II DNA or RNA helicase
MKHQEFIKEFMVNETNHRGLLLFHEMGSGKTMASLAVAEALDRKVVVLLPASLKSNWIRELGEINAEYKLPSKNRQISESEFRKIKKNVEQKIAQKYTFVSHNAYNTAEQLKNLVDENNKEKNNENSNTLDNDMVYKTFKKNKLDNKLLIIDEVHNMLSNVMSEESKNGTAIFDMIMNARNLKIVALSATPAINDPYEIALLFNMLRGKIMLNGKKFTAFPDQYHDFKNYFINDRLNLIKNKFIFQERINGLVSFVKGAREDDIEVFPQQENKVERIEMSQYQFKLYSQARYLEAMKEQKGKQFKNLRTSAPKYKKPYSDSSIDFKTNSRTLSNFVFPEELDKPKSKKVNETILEYNKRVNVAINQLTEKHLTKQLDIYSPKFKKILENMKILKNGLILIYSNFVTLEGLGIFSKVLEYHGYSNFLDKDNKGKDFLRYAEYSGKVDNHNRDKIIKAFNHPENNYGKKIRILMITAAGAEGLDLKNIRQVHIMEPYWHNVRTRQAIGRAVRLCSHVSLPVKERKVNVYIYVAVKPKDYNQKVNYKEKETTDEFLYKRSISKEKLLGSFLRAMKEVAIDCRLNFERNKGRRGLKNIEECLMCNETNLPMFHPDLSVHSIEGNSKCKRKDVTISQKLEFEGKEYGVSDIFKLYDMNEHPPVEVGEIYNETVVLY